jgi:hypothetical protein
MLTVDAKNRTDGTAGPVTDQAQLMGLIERTQELHCELISVEQRPGPATDQPCPTNEHRLVCEFHGGPAGGRLLAVLVDDTGLPKPQVIVPMDNWCEAIVLRARYQRTELAAHTQRGVYRPS